MKNEIIKNMPINDYHAHDGLSNSRMKYLLPPSCPYRYWTEYLDPNKPKEEKPAHFSLGSAVHSLVLEPQRFYQDNYVMPKYDRRTRDGKECYAEALQLSAGKNLINEEQYQQAFEMAQSVLNRIPWFQKVIADKNTAIEESLFWVDEETGIQLKSRPDIYTNDFYIDLKTTSKGLNTEEWTRQVINNNYYIQAAMAREALQKLHGVKYNYFMHVVVEETYPYLTACHTLCDDFINLGEEKFKEATKIYKECIEKNHWPDFGHMVQQIYLPHWMK